VNVLIFEEVCKDKLYEITYLEILNHKKFDKIMVSFERLNPIVYQKMIEYRDKYKIMAENAAFPVLIG
jgi:pheromone shutdown protein TraB